MKFDFKLEDVKYIKISYINANNEEKVIKAALKSFDDTKMLSCTKFIENLDILPEQNVVLGIVCSNGIYKAKTTIQNIENEEPYTFLIFDIPEKIEYQQQREFFRVAVEYNCTLQINDENTIIELPARTFNVSANGVCLILDNHKITNTYGNLIININNKLLNIKVCYIRSEKFGEKYKVSFAFVNIPEQDRDFLAQTCLKVQLEQKRNSLN